MAIEKINFSYPKSTLQTVYDTEATTALELASLTSAKVDECVELVNGVEQTATESRNIVDTMRTQQEQFVTENNDTRQALIAENQAYIDSLNTSKTQFEANMINEINSVVSNSQITIQDDVNAKIDVLINDGTIENLLNQQILTDIKSNITDTDLFNYEASGVGVLSGCQVLPQSNPNMTILVSSGMAHTYAGHRYVQNDNITIGVNPANSLYPRIDIVYIDTNNTIQYGMGEAKSTPAPPAPANALILAEILVNVGVNSIVNNLITDRRIFKVSNPQLNEALNSLQATVADNKASNDGAISRIEAIGKNLIIDYTGNIDASPLINSALNAGIPVKLQKGIIKTLSPLIIPKDNQEGIEGMGEQTIIKAGFTGGAVIVAEGGKPTKIKNLKIDRSVTANTGDNGVEIGMVYDFEGRGDFSNLFITNQYDGFKWKWGSFQVYDRIHAVRNKRHGFYGLNARGTLRSCLAMGNFGNGYHIYSDGGGDSGLTFMDTLSFANQGFGYNFDALDNTIWTGNFYFTGVTSSTDGRGGINFQKQVRQVHASNIFVETAGYAHEVYPEFVEYPAPDGILFDGDTVYANLSSITVINSKGRGFVVIGGGEIVVNGLEVRGNGRGAVNGFTSGLVLIGPTTPVVITGLLATKKDYTGADTQTYGIAVSTNDVNTIISGGYVEGVYNATGSNIRIINVVGADLI